jgi:CRP-like cAMP-binding protein
MARRAELIQHLSGVPMFRACTKKELQAISRLMTLMDVDAGAVLTREGDRGQEFMIVVEGEAVATRRGRKIATFGPGQFFGEIALLDPGERTATVVADTPMEIGVVSQQEFNQMLTDVPMLARQMLRGMAHVVRELNRGQPV